ncbi:MAG TPA: DUF3560 domain-containing protein [Actinospica sp.]|jgi:hypothetical protein|nr:DUF3560 domain-containing protein [Actinospica sp.]
MSVITLTHTPAEGTLADGTSRGDTAGPVLKANRFRFSRTLGLWYLPHSRDKSANARLIEHTAAALREAGHSVEITIDNDAVRPFAEAEAERAERAEERAERYAGYADNAATRSDARARAGHGMLDVIPLGQPILIGHHSEKRDRAYRNRALGHLEKSFEEADKAARWSDRSTAVTSHQQRRESTGTTLRRIEKLEADERYWVRTLETGHNSGGWSTETPEKVAEINRRLAAVREQLEHWRARIAEKEKAGVKIWSREDFKKGDFARIGNHWNEIIRVNAKSLTVPYVNNWSRTVLRRDDPTFLWPWTRPYNEVSGRLSRQEMTDLVHEAALNQPAETDAA